MKSKNNYNLFDTIYTTAILGIFGYLTYLIILSLQNILNKIPEYKGIFNVFGSIFIFWFILAILYPFILRNIFTLKEGEFNFNEKSLNRFIWGQLSFSYMFSAELLNYVVPSFLKAQFYKIIGVNMGEKVVCGGKITEPWITYLGNNVTIGEATLFMPHAITTKNKEKIVYLKKIVVEDNVTIGARAIIMHGVVIGKNSIVATNSVVTPNTQIPENEFWGGIPAKKIKDIK